VRCEATQAAALEPRLDAGEPRDEGRWSEVRHEREVRDGDRPEAGDRRQVLGPQVALGALIPAAASIATGGTRRSGPCARKPYTVAAIPTASAAAKKSSVIRATRESRSAEAAARLEGDLKEDSRREAPLRGERGSCHTPPVMSKADVR